MYRQTTEKQVYKFVTNNPEKIKDIKVMLVSKPYGFNNMEGYHADIRLKIETTKEYKNMFVEFTINSTYLDNCDSFNNYANILVDNLLTTIMV